MLFEDTYKTIVDRSEGLYKEKGSKFIAKAIPVADEKEIKDKLNEIKTEYHDARHHCFACLIAEGVSFLILQNLQLRVHIFPSNMNVAVPLDQHSPRFGQRALSQTVFK